MSMNKNEMAVPQ